MQILKAANLLIAFLLEQCMVAAFAYWGFFTGQILLAQLALGIGVPLIAIIIWGYWMAPNSQRRLRGKAYLALKIVLFGTAAAALIITGQLLPALIFMVFFIVNQTFIYVWNQ
jgi:hypothetical protein